MAVFAIQLASCSWPTASEISRVSNPTATIDAVIAELNTNATVATPSEIYLVLKGEKIHGDAIFRADRVEDMKLKWTDTNTLIIQAETARIFLNSPI